MDEISANNPVKFTEEFNNDFVSLVNSLGNLEKNRAVSYKATRFEYLNWDGMLGAIKKLAPNFAYTLELSGGCETTSLTPRLLHRKTGEIMLGPSYKFETPKGSTPQVRASEVTYFKRLVTSCFFGIACDTDNDCTDQTPEVITHNQPAPAPVQQQKASKKPAPAPAPVHTEESQELWTKQQQETLSAYRRMFETEAGKKNLTAYNPKAVDFNSLLMCRYGTSLPFHKGQDGVTFMYAKDADKLIDFLTKLSQNNNG